MIAQSKIVHSCCVPRELSDIFLLMLETIIFSKIDCYTVFKNVIWIASFGLTGYGGSSGSGCGGRGRGRGRGRGCGG